jgi:CBS domain-containing protein
MTTVGEICGHDVVVATPEMTVSEAAKLMRHRHVGSLVIVEKMNGGLRTPVGIVTDRDLVVEVTAVGLDPNTITVGDIMPRELVTVRADEAVLGALQLMRAKGVRRLPIVNEDGRLLGLVAFDDLLDVITDELSDLAKVVAREQAREATGRK